MLDRNYTANALAGQPMGGSTMDHQAKVANPVQPETEVQYAARMASDSLAALEKSIHVLIVRLESVLTQDAPATMREATPQRPVGSRMGAALIAHAEQIDGLERMVRSVSDRVAL